MSKCAVLSQFQFDINYSNPWYLHSGIDNAGCSWLSFSKAWRSTKNVAGRQNTSRHFFLTFNTIYDIVRNNLWDFWFLFLILSHFLNLKVTRWLSSEHITAPMSWCTFKIPKTSFYWMNFSVNDLFFRHALFFKSILRAS